MKVFARQEKSDKSNPSNQGTSSPAPEPNWAAAEDKASAVVSHTTIQQDAPDNDRVPATQSPSTTTPAASEIAPVKPTGPKLQGIIFNPTSPSATINGKAVFVGEKVGEWKVIAIDRESATVVSAGQTNILKLGE